MKETWSIFLTFSLDDLLEDETRTETLVHQPSSSLTLRDCSGSKPHVKVVRSDRAIQFD